MKTGPKPKPLVERIRRLIAIDGRGCWLWLGSVNPRCGYGTMRVAGKTSYAHRVSYQVFRGPIPVNRELDHLCRVRRCVNPRHLEIVTSRENNRRSDSQSGRNMRKTHCDSGHEFAGENLYITPQGKRGCRACRRAVSLRSYYRTTNPVKRGRYKSVRHQKFGAGE
jgi:hypothetical protein